MATTHNSCHTGIELRTFYKLGKHSDNLYIPRPGPNIFLCLTKLIYQNCNPKIGSAME